MTLLSSLCVYCGSSAGVDPHYLDAARTLGAQLAEQNIRLIYGGGTIGMMGALSSSVLQNGGQVTGIIPHFLLEMEATQDELEKLDTLIITKDMHERKRKMFELADAFIALPGGIGTLEELVEQLTWAQLGRHQKPILLANINNFWQPLTELITHMRAQVFIRPDFDINFLSAQNVDEMIHLLRKALKNCTVDDAAASNISQF